MNQHIVMMQLAEAEAKKSLCKRAQVGAVAVAVNGRVSAGHNHNNGKCCESDNGKTLATVVHAEAAAMQMLPNSIARPNIKGWQTLYVTRQPCIKCARLIVETGIAQVFYRDADDKTDGLELLAAHGVKVDSGWIAGQREPLIEPSLMQKIQASWLARWAV